MTQRAPTLTDIPLRSVVGSVGRCSDFTRTFSPKRASDEARWTRVLGAMLSPDGVPPIRVFALLGHFYVLDGHHRVSVARSLGYTHLEAYVTEVRPLEPRRRSAQGVSYAGTGAV